MNRQVILNNPTGPILQSAKIPDREACTALAAILLHSMNVADFLPDNQYPISPGPGTSIAFMVENGKVIGSYA
jgi:hypothetical protein